MGDWAEAMLDGELCYTCGAYIGDPVGYPLQCASCLKEEHREAQREKNRKSQPLSKKALNLLKLCQSSTDNPDGMYPGAYLDSAPAQYRKLINRGLCEEVHPHNKVHSTRVVITDLGREALKVM